MNKTNERVRKAMKECGIKQWQLAELMKISEFTMCKKLRKELPDIEQSRIIWLMHNEADRVRPADISEADLKACEEDMRAYFGLAVELVNALMHTDPSFMYSDLYKKARKVLGVSDEA